MHSNLDFVALHTHDLAAARRFYSETLGFETLAEPPGALIFRTAAGASWAVREPRPGEAQSGFGAGVSIWFGVPEVDALHARLGAAGVAILTPPHDGPFGRMFALTTPDGHTLTLHQVPA